MTSRCFDLLELHLFDAVLIASMLSQYNVSGRTTLVMFNSMKIWAMCMPSFRVFEAAYNSATAVESATLVCLHDL